MQLYEGKTPITDEYGNVTGEYDVQHGKPTEFYANISAAKGETQTRQFGENESYDKVIVMDSDAPRLMNMRCFGLTSRHNWTKTALSR